MNFPDLLILAKAYNKSLPAGMVAAAVMPAPQRVTGFVRRSAWFAEESDVLA